MNQGMLPGLSGSRPRPIASQGLEQVTIDRPLQRVLAFTRRSIDDVINDPLARSEVLGYYKLHCWVRRECEISELERQWNPI